MLDSSSRDHRFHSVLERLEAVVDAENAAIGSDRDYDFMRSNAAKSRCLYDMTMLFKDIDPAQLGDTHREHLGTVKQKLDTNNSRIKAHMEAVREIAEMIKESVAASEADGTYSINQFRGTSLS
ncbi:MULTISPECIES: hypothetical protein [unclassified Hoeflea]|uniref:hypothetical protein n=1 Tax=unclassified Hoeflea TaxID=2614931 RepID=UPI00398F94D7